MTAGSVLIMVRRMALRPAIVLLVALGLVVTDPPHAFAYIDPNASSLLFQIASPIVAVVIWFMVFVRDSLKERLRRLANLIRRSRDPGDAS